MYCKHVLYFIVLLEKYVKIDMKLPISAIIKLRNKSTIGILLHP